MRIKFNLEWESGRPGAEARKQNILDVHVEKSDLHHQVFPTFRTTFGEKAPKLPVHSVKKTLVLQGK
ncbi:hypothetical protein scyTo_0010602 [Scyliorhinus torazame]|uniref:Uncharacterized protein n=1 Tax=Scyliorhinus torazame TaxID=75743 RepID=A0A401P978_SCYTO|nr:hypothetical protein [Scyliorhinus torazame]